MIEVIPPDTTNHRCGPNRSGFWLNHWNRTPGTVLACTICNKSWVAVKPHPMSGYMGVLWFREGWFARRRRLKRARKQSSK